MKNTESQNIPIWEKQNLTIQEASEYSNIGVNKLYKMVNEPNCPYVLSVGQGRKLIKKKLFDKYIEANISI